MPKQRTKTSRTGKGKSKKTEKPAGLLSRLRESGWSVSDVVGVITRGSTAVLIAAIVIGWIVGREPLRTHVAEIRSDPLLVDFDWPIATNASSSAYTWVPIAVQNHLHAVASAHLSMNPLDQHSLELTRAALIDTGWLEEATVRRLPGGKIRISGTWRAHAALVQHQNREYLVARHGELLELPAGAGLNREALFTIFHPYAGPPVRDAHAAYGAVWRGDDISAALDLLAELSRLPGAAQIVGINLRDMLRTDGHLVIMTDSGAEIVWGSPIGELAPGEVSVQQKLARLAQNQQRYGRLDAGERRLIIHTPHMFVDESARAG